MVYCNDNCQFWLKTALYLYGQKALMLTPAPKRSTLENVAHSLPDLNRTRCGQDTFARPAARSPLDGSLLPGDIGCWQWRVRRRSVLSIAAAEITRYGTVGRRGSQTTSLDGGARHTRTVRLAEKEPTGASPDVSTGKWVYVRLVRLQREEGREPGALGTGIVETSISVENGHRRAVKIAARPRSPSEIISMNLESTPYSQLAGT